MTAAQPRARGGRFAWPVRAARFLGEGRIELDERPAPVPAADEVLVRVHACAICGSDRTAYREGATVTPGHEIAGTVAAVGGDVAGLAEGDRGVVYLVDFCGRCRACRAGSPNMCLSRLRMYGFTADGGYADYVRVRAHCFRRVADDVPLDAATALLDLFGTARHALARGGFAAGADVCVLGCGPIGLGVIAAARALGAGRVHAVDVAAPRLELAARAGAVAIDGARGDAVAAVRARAPDGVPLVVEAAGVPSTQRAAIELCGPGGRVVFVAHCGEPLAVRTSVDLIARERALVGSEYFPLAELAATEELVRAGRLDPAPLITHRVALAGIEDGFRRFFAGETGKVLVQP
jgi:threonine 3-dehydrogenase